MNKNLIIILTVSVAILVGLFVVSGGKEDLDSGEFVYSEDVLQEQDFDYAKGEGNVGTIIEYGDFQCPACQQYFGLLTQLKQEMGDDLKFIFRHFPLTRIHPNAMAAHRAAEAAGRQGKFFEMHDMLYIRQDQWSNASDAGNIFEGYAQELNLDMEKYKADVLSSSVFSRINADLKTANGLGLTGTPTFYVNGELVTETPRSVDEFKVLLGVDETADQPQDSDENQQ